MRKRPSNATNFLRGLMKIHFGTCYKRHDDKEEENPMQLRYFFLTILLFSVSDTFGFAQQSTEWTLPEGTIAHLGKEWQ